MRDEALFVNGVFESVLQDILAVQAQLPEQILYLQPYSGERIVHLAENAPSVDNPVRLFASISSDLPHVHYVGEVVGWDDKRELSPAKRHVLNRVIYLLQPTEEGVYETGGPGRAVCANLLRVRRLKRLATPFSVELLTKTVNQEPVSPDRQTPGGWVYVRNLDRASLEPYL